LIIFIIVDRLKNKHHVSQRNNVGMKIEGGINVFLMGVIVVLTLFAPQLSRDPVLVLLGQNITWQDIARDFGYLAIGMTSLFLTSKHIHKEQHFNFDPFNEVARVFWVIFLSLIPISAMLKLGSAGPFHALFNFAHDVQGLPIATRYFWLSGSLSAFLDNAPTYLLFFKMAGNNAQILMHELPSTLLAISLGSVYMGP
jgi:Na+/H+ antiporter NhaD/arsenite permease-like protein